MTMHGLCFLQGLTSLLLCVNAQGIPQLHLAEGGHRCVGRVEILHQGSWATICDDKWSMSEAHVVCRQIGCGEATSATLNGYFGSRPDSIHLNDPGCTGDETHLWQCPSWSWDQLNCTGWPAAGVICSGFVRLGGSYGLCSGRVEVNSGRGWILVSDVNFTFPTAQVICVELGCSEALSVLGNLSRNTSELVWNEEFQCEGQEPEVWLCPRVPCPGSSCQHGGGVEVVCAESPQLRLVDGGHRCVGRVEILHNDTWGTICDNDWDKRDADVVCRQLVCGEALGVTMSAYFSSGSGPIFLSHLSCTGEEPHVRMCPSQGWGKAYCLHSEDAGVICSGFVRLGGSNGLCSGRVEVNSGRGWILVSDVNFTFPTAQVICANLGCGKAVSVLGNVSRNTSEQVWNEVFQCEGQEPELRLCPRVPCPGGSCQHGRGVAVVCTEIPQLRLVNTESHCEGNVEIFHHGSWGTICDDSWDLSDAQVVCRQLNCGEALSATFSAHFGQGSGPIWLDEVNCTGEESHVLECLYKDWRNNDCEHEEDAGVICSGYLRLAGEEGPCSGRVELNSRGKWVPVSDVNFTFHTAQVICAELGCGKAASVLGNVTFSEYTGQMWHEEFLCEGQESQLWFCPRAPCHGGRCHHKGIVQIVCSEFAEVRLVKNGTSQCEGQVEVNTSAGWRALCASHWSMTNANVVCHQLGCGVAIATPKGEYFVEEGDEIRKDQFHCSGDEPFLRSCPVIALGVPACAHGNTASVVCTGNKTQLLPQYKDSLSNSGDSTASEVQDANCLDSRQLRLVNGGTRCAGRVEILHQGSWGTICDDSWDLNDAHVVCRQMNCGVALNATVSAHFGQGSGPIWLDELNCTGEETHVWNCPSQGWEQHDCRHKEDAGVICSEFLDLRMVSQDQECSGWLEIFYNGTWGSVCLSPMEEVTLSVICKQLGCGDTGILNTSVPARKGSRPQWVDGIQCRKTDTSLWQCPSDAWNQRSCIPRDSAYVTCTGLRPKSCPESAPCTDTQKLRLRGGDSKCSGRVELWYKGSWGTVCDDSWDLAEAEVVCQQLGCGHALAALGKAAFGPGNGSIWLDEMQCRGRESSLWDCARAPWGQSDCKHEEDAGVRCSDERTTVSPIDRSTSSSSPPVPGFFSLPVIICIILGALLLLVLIVLGTQMRRWKTVIRDPLKEAFYEEIRYLVKPQEDMFDNTGKLFEDSVTKLPYYTEENEENEENEDPRSASEHPEQHAVITENGYDDIEELPFPKIPSSPEMSEMHCFPQDGGGARNSQSSTFRQPPREGSNSSMEEKGSPLSLRQENFRYDDVELSVM
ncbi:antigen WC1.1-like isoform X1 [Cavia porcellus]|uniref:antigen WC1.1-like isoform X1 n=1 Tax=Cavia porcellus TaxID=10141 RepID=UPI002FDFB796